MITSRTPGHPSPLLSVENLNAWYDRSHVVQNISFTVGRGEIVTLMGRNGAGKTTTLRTLMGLLVRRSGTVVFDGQALHDQPAHVRYHRGLAYVPEDRRIVPGLTVRENLLLGIIASTDRGEADTRIDAIADTFNRKFGKRPSVHPDRPDVLFHLHVDNHRVTVSLDSSGESLNRRGYRSRGARAPLNEVLAAGMIMLTGWRGESHFYDPMCGSGTLAIEANMIARRMPPQALRNEFGFMRWMSFDKGLWQQVKRDAMQHMIEPTHRIFASDADTFQMRTARENIENAGFEDDIELTQRDFMELVPVSEEGIIVMNPPYGERMDEENIIPMYKAIGDHLKHACAGHSAWIISSDEAALKRVGLKPSRKFSLINGTLACKYYRFDLFAGKRNERHNKTSETPTETE